MKRTSLQERRKTQRVKEKHRDCKHCMYDNLPHNSIMCSDCVQVVIKHNKFKRKHT